MTLSPLLPAAGSPAGASSPAPHSAAGPHSCGHCRRGPGGCFGGLARHAGWRRVELRTRAPPHARKDSESPKLTIPFRTSMDQGPSLDGDAVFLERHIHRCSNPPHTNPNPRPRHHPAALQGCFSPKFNASSSLLLGRDARDRVGSQATSLDHARRQQRPKMEKPSLSDWQPESAHSSLRSHRNAVSGTVSPITLFWCGQLFLDGSILSKLFLWAGLSARSHKGPATQGGVIF